MKYLFYAICFTLVCSVSIGQDNDLSAGSAVYYQSPIIENIEIIDGKLEITQRQKSAVWVSTELRAPTCTWKDIYEAKDGEIVFKERLDRVLCTRTVTKEVEEEYHEWVKQ